MNRTVILLLVSAVLAGTAAAAQLYRWVDDKGNVEYRDTPPPSSAKKVEVRNIGSSTIETSSLPYSLQQAAKNHPVTLWITNCGAPCDRARAHLVRRGVPYTERDPQHDIEAFKKLTGGLEVPVLYIGSNQIKSYLESEWDAALDTAGYPRTAFTVGGKPVVKPVVVPAPKPEAAAPQTPEPRASEPKGDAASR
jgi:uncharacterized protein DUF4124